MRLTPAPSQGDLPLPLAKPSLVHRARHLSAMPAGDARLVLGPRDVLRREGPPTGMAEHMAPVSQPVLDAHPTVEDKAGAMPEALVLGHLLKVSQDPAL